MTTNLLTGIRMTSAGTLAMCHSEVELFPARMAENISRFRDEGTIDFEGI